MQQSNKQTVKQRRANNHPRATLPPNCINRGVLWGQLLTGLEAAWNTLVQARRGELLLSEADRRCLVETIDALRGIEQRAWTAKAVEAAAKMRARPKTRALARRREVKP